MVIWAKTLLTAGVGLLFLLFVFLFFALGWYRKQVYISNYEESEYADDGPYRDPDSIIDGLAVYSLGSGEPVLLLPYPHGHTTEPMVQGPLSEILVYLGRKVITFDVPGAYRSLRPPVGDMEEMVRAATEALDRLSINSPVDVLGHSMGGLAALAFAVERPERTKSLSLIASLSGFPAAAKWGFPRSAYRIYQRDFWRVVLWGMRLNGGRGSLALHKKLQNLMSEASHYDKSYFTPLEIDGEDSRQGVPIRTIWAKNMYRRLSFADRLGEVRVPTLIVVGRHDPQAPLACSEELATGIADSNLVVFEQSGHSPFSEEKRRFTRVLEQFYFKMDQSIY